MDTLKNVIRNNRMDTAPSFYSGRGATLTDLNSDILRGIHKGIKKEFGKNASENFIKMVAGIKVASATTFLNELYSLLSNGWKYTEKENDASGIDIAKNEDGSHNLASAMFTMGEALMGDSNRDDTALIVCAFLCENGIPMEHFDEWSADGVTRTTYYG